jgi:hypothetical protein
VAPPPRAAHRRAAAARHPTAEERARSTQNNPPQPSWSQICHYDDGDAAATPSDHPKQSTPTVVVTYLPLRRWGCRRHAERDTKEATAVPPRGPRTGLTPPPRSQDLLGAVPNGEGSVRRCHSCGLWQQLAPRQEAAGGKGSSALGFGPPPLSPEAGEAKVEPMKIAFPLCTILIPSVRSTAANKQWHFHSFIHQPKYLSYCSY